MLKPGTPTPLLMLALALCAGCQKDDTRIRGIGSGRPHLELCVDSSFIQAPNVFTPNGDGINDSFSVLALNVASLDVWILNSSGEEVTRYNTPFFGWDGTDTSGSGPYMVWVQARTTSGVTVSGKSSLVRLEYGNGSCLNYGGTAVFGDQLDPRICGPSHPTNEVLCP
jgi:gliding motility-associated-like protein